jgi:HSP20 family molecular chaperone IbpA
VVTADIPGVTPDHLDVRVDNNVLTIRAQADHTSADVGERPGTDGTQLERFGRPTGGGADGPWRLAFR